VGSLRVIAGSLASRRNKRRAEKKKEKRFDTLTLDDEEDSGEVLCKEDFHPDGGGVSWAVM
jgi:hypothetical protein